MPRPPYELFYEKLAGGASLEQFITRKRDLILLDFIPGYMLVIACDSNGSIGMKKNDYLKREYKEVGRCASKVPLMEVLAAGAFPFVVVNNLCVEMEPSGTGILEGIRFEVERLGLDPDLVITGSTEKNMLTTQTGLGVTVIGMAKKEEIKIGVSKPGDLIVCVGIPKSSPEQPFKEGEPEIFNPPGTRALRSLAFVHDIIPVGSHGVGYEMNILAEESGCSLEVIEGEIDMVQSAGPSTCAIASLAEEDLSTLKEKIKFPIHSVGVLGYK